MDEAKIYEGFFRAFLTQAGDWISKLFSRKKKDFSNDEIKALTNILFVDDEEFPHINRIREAGWNVQHVPDISNLDDEHLKRADIIFLDYVGVGRHLSPTQQGIGLLKAIKHKYQEKIIIFYSAHTGFTLGDEFDEADDWLLKHSDPYVYLQKIEENARKLKKFL